MRTLLSIIIYIGSALYAMGAYTLELSMEDYLNKVLTSNLGLACEKLNLNIAEADEEAARVFTDPTLAVEYADNDDHRMQMGRSVSAELGYTWAPGKRGARVNLARSEKELQKALLNDFLRNLRFEALSAYYEARKASEMLDMATELAALAADVARGDSLRLTLGDIGEAGALQTSIDARMARADEASARSDYYSALLTLNSFAGITTTDTICVPLTGGVPEIKAIDAATMEQTAVERRADLQAALKNIEVARRALTVEKKERNMEFDLALGYNYNTEVRNELAPAPRFSGMTIGVGIPLKFSNSNKGALKAASLKVEQAEIEYADAVGQVRREVAAAWFNYQRAVEVLGQYSTSLVEESESTLTQYRDLYSRGDISLVEYREMRETQIALRTAYIDARYNCAAALLSLYLAIGL